MSLLEINNLHVHYKVYGGLTRVLDGVNLTVNEGEKVGLVGETGCGKTTAMKTVLNVLPMPPAVVDSGEVLYKGENLLQMRSKQMQTIRGREISMIFQDPMSSLNPVFTVAQQLEPVLRHATGGDLSKKAIRERAVSALRDVALADPERLLKAYPTQLSGGMRQRVAIGMALATDPKLLIADEPGTALDVTIQAQVLKLLNDLVTQKQTSIILITHSLGVVRENADRVYVMYAGNMVEMAPTKKLFANPLHPYTQGLMASVPKLSGGGVSLGIPGRIPDYLNPPTGCRFHDRCPRVMDRCKIEKPPVYLIEGDVDDEQASPPPLLSLSQGETQRGLRRLGGASEQHTVACFLYEDGQTIMPTSTKVEAVA